jgi:hypothetical protein
LSLFCFFFPEYSELSRKSIAACDRDEQLVVSNWNVVALASLAAAAPAGGLFRRNVVAAKFQRITLRCTDSCVKASRRMRDPAGINLNKTRDSRIFLGAFGEFPSVSPESKAANISGRRGVRKDDGKG